MTQAALLPLLYDAHATGGWTAGMVRVTRAMLADVAMPPGATVLEVGCGLGAMAHALQSTWPAAHVIGADIHPQALANATGSHRPDFVQASGLRLPFPAQAIDLLLALDSFDQAGIDLPTALAEARRVLRPGGLLLLRVSAHPRLQGAHDRGFNTGRRYTRAEICYMLKSADYEIERFSYANFLLAAPAVALRTLDNMAGNADELTTAATAVYASAAANRAVHAALALEAAWLRRATLPAGLSLLVLATRNRNW